MSLPANPVNGQTAISNNITYVYSSGNNAWTRVFSSNITANVLTASGNIVASGNITTSNISVSGKINGTTYAYNNGESPGYTYALDDISNRFDGQTTSFPLTYNNGTAISPNNPNQVRIVIGNNDVLPATYVADYQNLPETPVWDRGFKISGSNILFPTAPTPGMSFYGTVRTNSDLMPTFNTVQVPFKALNIMLGA